MDGIRDTVVTVTGAAQGIGERIARCLGDHGARLLLADVQRDRVEQVAASLRQSGAEAAAAWVDVSVPESARALAATALERFGRIDALVANAAIDAPRGLAWDIDEDHWRRLIDVNLSGTWWCVQAVLPAMLAQRRGKIVLMSSVVARLGSAVYSPAYAAAKAGLLGLTVGLAAQVEARGVLVNAITPGPTGTTGTAVTDEEARQYRAGHPLGFGGPQPAADAVGYLLASSGDWISGAVLNVSGGELRGL